MDPRALHELVGRPWDEAEASKVAYWADRFRRDGWQAVWNAAQALLAHARAVRPDFPSDRERERDLADHLSLRNRLDQAAHAFTRR